GAPAQNPDRWAAGQLYLAHFTVSDLSDGEFYTAERLARGAQGEAYAAADRLEVKVVDWSARAEGSALVLHSSAPWGALELNLTPAAPLLLHGDRGLSPKGSGPGNASYYYSLPELTTTGAITMDGVRWSVDGVSWLDREWSTSVLSSEQVGWDWFSMNLGEGRYLMLFQLRDASGAPDSYSAGTLVTPASQHQLTAADFTLRPERRWRSPVSGVVYPVAWSIELPAQQLKLKVEPLLDEQELNLTFRYWEGAVRATGSLGAQPVRGQGYLEMTGYE
ncbi:MAG: lipocalin family protein, partial [Pseudomonadota bacterium]